MGKKPPEGQQLLELAVMSHPQEKKKLPHFFIPKWVRFFLVFILMEVKILQRREDQF